jgi:hypothetical protein
MRLNDNIPPIDIAELGEFIGECGIEGRLGGSEITNARRLDGCGWLSERSLWHSATRATDQADK